MVSKELRSTTVHIIRAWRQNLSAWQKSSGLFVSAGSDFHRLEDDSHGMLGTKTLDWEHMGSYYRQLIMERKKDMGANV